mgnify:CR=1 FL=1
MASIIKANQLQDFGGNSIITSDGAGTITLSSGMNTAVAVGTNNTPAFEAYLSSTQSSVSDATATKVQFNTEVFDTDGCYDNSSNYRFTPTTAGKYYIYFVFIGAVAGVSRLSQIAGQIYKNGSVYTETSIDNRSAGYGLNSTVTSVSTIDMNGSSDYVECYGYVNDDSGGTVSFYGDGAGSRCVFGAYKIIGA